LITGVSCCERSAVSYDLVGGSAVKVPSHSSVPSGGFVGEGAPPFRWAAIINWRSVRGSARLSAVS
jgi:hypothetical protein